MAFSSTHRLLALRMLARDWRAGELRLLAVALVIAVGAVTSVGFFADRVQRGLGQQSAELLGANLVVTGQVPPDPEWRAHAQAIGVRHADVVEFATVVLKGERLQLASVRAVMAGYPVRGHIRTSPAPFAPDAIADGTPAPGTVWVETRLLSQIDAQVGDRVDIGAARFTIDRVLTHEPGWGGSLFTAAPRVLMHAQDLSATAVLQPGSRATYARTFAGPEDAIARLRAWLEPRLSTSHRLIGARDGNRAVARAVTRVDRYIGLTSLIAVVLAGVAIAMGARRYSERHYDVSAMLRCLGCTQRDIIALYLPQLAVLGIAASAVGCALGWLGQAAIYLALAEFFPVVLPPPSSAPLVLGFAVGMTTLAGFALPPVLRLKHVPPLRVLRRELAPPPPSATLVVAVAAAAMVAMLLRYTQSWTLVLGVLGGAVAAVALLGAGAYALLRVSRRWRDRVGVTLRFGVNNLWRRPGASVAQLISFGLAFMALALAWLVRTDLVTSFQQQLPADAPNHFVFNVLPTDVPAVEHFFARHGITAQALYPIVRGRLVARNGVPMTRAVSKEEDDHEALRRELNLTWAGRLPPDNAITGGAWHVTGDRGGVSVEARLAERLEIALGDELGFAIGGQTFSARVTSLRTVQWDSFHPNFYMIFAPGALDRYPATYLTSFHIAPQQKTLLAQLVRAFPSVTVLETDQILAQVRTVMRQVTAAVEFVLLFVLAAGLAVLYAALQASLDERRYEGALLRALGASHRQLALGRLAEFAALGFCAGLLAAAGTELSVWVLYTRVFELEYSFKWPVWLAAPVFSAVLLAAAGVLGTRRIARQSPLAVLRGI